MEINWLPQKLYYWNARLNGKTALLSGPFLTASEAENTADIVSPIFIQEHPEALNATFGVMQCKSPGAGYGINNKYLPHNLFKNVVTFVMLN